MLTTSASLLELNFPYLSFFAFSGSKREIEIHSVLVNEDRQTDTQMDVHTDSETDSKTAIIVKKSSSKTREFYSAHKSEVAKANLGLFIGTHTRMHIDRQTDNVWTSERPKQTATEGHMDRRI